MATTLPPQIEGQVEREPLRPRRGGGSGGPGNRAPDGGNLREVEDRSGDSTRTGIWVGLASIAMIFAAFTSALYVREGAATDWHHIPVPPILYLNSLILIFASIALEIARRRVSAFMRGVDSTPSGARVWLFATLGLGIAFVVGQYMAWLQLRRAGLYLATNPNSSFFYVLTGVHAVHVLGGLGGLLRVITKFSGHAPALRRSTLDATAYYWHFMGILWLYLLFIIWIKL